MSDLTYEQTAHPCFGDRPVALAERCEREGLGNCAATIRGLLEERNALLQVLAAHLRPDEFDMAKELQAAFNLTKGRGLSALARRPMPPTI